MRTTSFRKKPNVCTNCGEDGHQYRQCRGPITSYGIIAVRNKEEVWNPTSLEVLLIQRRDSIGFIELLRAKYKLTDVDYIRQQIDGTTEHERQKLRSQSFYDLWVGLWGSSPKENKQYKQEFEQAAYKFEQLKEGYEVEGTTISLDGLLSEKLSIWQTPEWGFPKGRRNQFETDKQCACREFEEETGLTEDHFSILETIEPIRETFYGNNGIHYCHVYFLALVSSSASVVYDETNEHMKQEIGGLEWVPFSEAIHKIRSTNPEKRAILTRAEGILRKVVPVNLGGSAVFGSKFKSAPVDREGNELQLECPFRGSRAKSTSRTTRKAWRGSSIASWFTSGSGSGTSSGGGELISGGRGGESGGELISGGGELQSEYSGGGGELLSNGSRTSSSGPSSGSGSTEGSENTNPWITASSRSTRKHKQVQRSEPSATCEFLDE